MNALLPTAAEAAEETWQAGFLRIYHTLEKYARHAFQHFPAEAREDAVSEVVASILVAYRRLHERDELHRAKPPALVRYAIRQYYDGRRVGSPQNCRDVLSPLAKRKAGYEICGLGAPGEQVGAWLECLVDDHQTPVLEQVCFRIDFPRWLNSQTRRNRQIAERLSLGFTTGEVAKEFNVSKGRISQLRQELAESWQAFHEPAQHDLLEAVA